MNRLKDCSAGEALVDREIEHLRAQQRSVGYELQIADGARKSVEPHPNYHRFVLGGSGAAAGQTSRHIVPMIGAFATPAAAIVRRLASVSDGGEVSLARLTDLTRLIDADDTCAATGMAVLADKGLLHHGKVREDWLDHPKLGLGQGPCFDGLRAGHNRGYVGLWSLDRDAFVSRFAASPSATKTQTFGEAVFALIDGDPGDLEEFGTRVLHARAKAAYHEDCASFAAWQRANPDASAWRSRPPNSGQGYLARTTAVELNEPLPMPSTRGDAAVWLADHNANRRFRKD